MSRLYSSPLWSGTLGTTKDITKFVQVSLVAQDIYEEAGFGGSADIFSGKYINQDGGIVKVAIKSIRAFNLGNNEDAQMERLEKKLARELKVWRTLSGGANIIELLGIMNGIGPLPSFVCELCPWNLQDYLERKTPPPRHTKMLTDTLTGLSYMHGLDSGPIAHGDIKLSNILVNSDETALICDFGRSRQPRDPSNEVILSSSSPFAGTVRYMSPELLVPESARPSTAADMWAYGCVALEILCRIQPYNETSSDVVVAEMIRSGRIPSDRPRGARGSLINDTLWSVLSSCWRAQDWRPTAEGFLEELNRMLHSGEVPSSPLLMDAIPRAENEPIPAWPSEIKDMRGQIKENSIAVHSRSPRATVWRAWTSTNYSVVIKVPRLNANLDNQVRHDQLEYIFRKIVSSRYGVHHPSIIDFLGITSEFSPHEGLVFEMCFEWTLEQYRMQNPMIPDTYTRSGHLYPNYYSLICDVIEGLRYMHGYPIPISHGDLTPSNISVDGQGKAKISVISFGRILAALPLDATVTSTANSGLAFRWISPELITASIPQPTTESDMWMFGCISFWLLTLQEPYASINRDDLAGIEIMRGRPPATLVSAYHLDTWITNGLWGAIARCWRQDPLQRPSATEFTRILERLEGRSIQWLPLNVTDLAGKVQFDLSKRQERNQIARHQSVWRRFSDAKSEILEEVDVKMGLYEATYTPKWYSRSTSVVIRAGFDFEFRANAVGALYSSIRHEVSLMAQIDHPSIHKLLGIDTSPTHTHLPDMVFEPLSQLTLQLVISQNTASYGERVKILRDVALAVTYLHEHSGGSIAHGDIQPANIFVLPDGKAKLANFTCAFQYISGQLKSSLQWSEVASTPSRPSLYCSPEFRDPFLFPTLAGDVWSFGVVVLASFSIHFQTIDLEEYMLHLDRGNSPLELPRVGVDCGASIHAILRTTLLFEPSIRSSMAELIPAFSRLL